MEINTVDDINALTAYKKQEKINSIEVKLKRMSFIPVIVGSVLMLWAFWGAWSGILWSPTYLVLVAVAIAVVGHTSNRRIDLHNQLFLLKYEK